jgi:hypothetical protein
MVPGDGGGDDDGDLDDYDLPPQNPYDPLIGKKPILEGYDRMKDAIPKLDTKPEDASNDQGKAAGKIYEALDEMEKRLKQMRLDEMEVILAALRHRCEKMKAMQTEVLEHPAEGTIATEKDILSRSDQKPNDADFQKSLRLAVKEKDIIGECDKCLDILRTDATGVAFPVAFEQVREDMRSVFRRLDNADVGKINQEIQREIIESLDDMIKALKQKEIEIQEQKSQPKPPGPAKEPKEPKEKSLLQRIQELKMIRAMQDRLNKRTEKYGKMYQGEQPSDPLLRREINELRPRQEQIFDITNKIHREVNK